MDGTETGDPKSMRELAPGLKASARVLQCVQALNHLAQEQIYSVIEDPAAFADWYKQRLASEDRDADWIEGTFRLSNYDAPDFSAIKTPVIDGDTLTFIAVNRQLGAVYLAMADLGDAGGLTRAYEPLVA
ncbi:hypothetical protein [Sedimentitalea todarodis]|uniref:Uncharacterized protein n=1 Tax=Sedimentitalea todarodis TaxID=1631240 RepID=A0ABU3VJE7_9RHOB|nr:hypothetical protein [Sedimentitalea todarodis]MDU9006279.1 hypothetical protein [Sedimentitalea todarodis]